MLRINFLFILRKIVNFSVILSSKRKMNSTIVHISSTCIEPETLGDFNFWLSLLLSLLLSETLSCTLKSGLRPKFTLTSV